MKKALFILFIFSNIWALQDRALFSIGETLIFVRKGNLYLKVMSESRCQERLGLLTKLTGISKESRPLDVTEAITTLEQKAIVNKLIILFKAMKSASAQREKLNMSSISKQCGVKGKEDINALYELVSTNDYIKQRMVTAKGSDDIQSSLTLFRQTFVDPIDHRAYY